MSDTAQSLSELVAETGRARDYFDGVRHSPLVLPDNIICFSHPHVAGLHPTHHSRFVLLQNIGGAGVICVDGNMFTLVESHAMLIFPFQAHNYPSAENASGWLFTTFEMPDYRHLEKLRNRVFECTHRSGELTRQLLLCYRSGEAAEGQKNDLCLYAALLLEEYMASARSMRPEKLSTTGFSAHQQTMRKLQRLVFDTIDKPVCIADLADQLSLSESHLRLLFRREFQTSLGQYIRGVKLTRACHLLSTRDCTVTEAATDCGYDSVYAFSRAFKTHYGVSPSAYRHRAASLHG